MFNKDNVFITVNEEVSSIIQQYIIREIKKVLDKYKSIVTEEISSVEKLINSISNEELMEEFLNDWSMSLKIAKEIGENEVDDRIISMYQNLKCNGLEELSIGHVINWCNELDEQGYVMIDDYSIIYKSSANLKDIAIELLDDMLDDAIHVDALIDKDSLVEYWIEQTSKEEVIDDLIRGNNIEELLGLVPETIYEEVDIRLQLMIWSMLDKLKDEGNVELDYLQIFKIRKDGNKIVINQSQEVPEYSYTYEIELEDIQIDDEIKLYVIDNGVEGSIILFPWEY